MILEKLLEENKMGIITRFKDIMESNLNALLDKCEDPEKMIDQYLRNAKDDYAKVKAETASIMAEEKSAKRKLDACEEEIQRMTDYAMKAVTAGNDNEAKQFLEKKADLSSKLAVLQQDYQAAQANASKMREMHDKLEKDVKSLESRRDMLKAKMKVAKTQEKLNNLTSGISNASGSLDAFSRMEDKVNKKLDEVAAMEELNGSMESESIEDLAKKYDDHAQTSAVDDELAALKAKMGL